MKRQILVPCIGNLIQCCQNVDKWLQLNYDIFVAKGYEHSWASSGHRLKWAFCGCHIDAEPRPYVRTASYAPASGNQLSARCII